MKQKFKSLRRVGAAAVISLLLISVANASLQVTFPWSLNPGQVQYFWGNDSDKTPSATGRTPSSTTGSPSQTEPSKPDSGPPSTIYGFWSGDASAIADSQSIGIRVWSDAAKVDGSVYTVFWGQSSFAAPYNNGALSPVSATFDKPFQYIKTSAGKAVISSYSETRNQASPTSPTPPAPTGTITFNSIQPLVGTYEVQIAASEWEVNGITYTGTNFSKDAGWFTAPSYTLKVHHKSYWDSTFQAWSDTLTYAPGVTPGGATSFNISLARPAGKGGVNFVIAPSTSNEVQNAMMGTSYPPSTPVTLAYAQVKTELELVNAINTIWGEQIVRTVGKWNPQIQQPSGTIVGYTSSSSTDLTLDFATTTALNVNLEKGAAYQVWLRPAAGGDAYMSFTLQGK